MIDHLRIPRDGLTLAGDLHLPDGFDRHGAVPAVVLATPGSSVKGQIGRNYASRLAAAGIPALTFDPAHQGVSEGEPRDLEDPYLRSDDLSFALDALSLQPGIDPSRLGALGICAGGGYATFAARTDHRIRALGTVVPVNIGEARRHGSDAAAALDALAAARAADVAASGVAETRVTWLPDTLADAEALGYTDIDTTQAITFYRTPRGADPSSTNRRLQRSDALLTGFDAFSLVPTLLTQPVQVIVAGRRGNTRQYEMGHQLAALAPAAEEVLVIEGAGHYELYDEPRYVDQAVARLTQFFARHL